MRGARAADMSGEAPGFFAGIRAHLADRDLAPGFAIGFCILFAFIGVFTFVYLMGTLP